MVNGEELNQEEMRLFSYISCCSLFLRLTVKQNCQSSKLSRECARARACVRARAVFSSRGGCVLKLEKERLSSLTQRKKKML